MRRKAHYYLKSSSIEEYYIKCGVGFGENFNLITKHIDPFFIHYMFSKYGDTTIYRKTISIATYMSWIALIAYAALSAIFSSNVLTSFSNITFMFMCGITLGCSIGVVAYLYMSRIDSICGSIIPLADTNNALDENAMANTHLSYYLVPRLNLYTIEQYFSLNDYPCCGLNTTHKT